MSSQFSDLPRYNLICRQITTTRSYTLQGFEKDGVKWNSIKDIADAHGVPYATTEIIFKINKKNRCRVLLGDSSEPVMCINAEGYREFLQLSYEWADKLQINMCRALLMQKKL